MHPTDAKAEELILQIYPRGNPSRAVVYHGDPEFIEDVLQAVGRRLAGEEIGTVKGDLRLLEDEDEEGEAGGP